MEAIAVFPYTQKVKVIEHEAPQMNDVNDVEEERLVLPVDTLSNG